MPRYVQFGSYDQLLTIDLKSEKSTSLLLDEMKKRTQLWVSKAPAQRPFAKDEYQREVVFASLPNMPYSPAMPGDAGLYDSACDWLYFRIPCTKSSAGLLLRQMLPELILLLRSKVQLSEWHYLIYPIPKLHVRVRLKVPPALHSSARNILKWHLAKLASSPIFAWEEHQYLQETRRYGRDMAAIHRLWTHDSDQLLSDWQDASNTDGHSDLVRTIGVLRRWAARVDQRTAMTLIQSGKKLYDREFESDEVNRLLRKQRTAALMDLPLVGGRGQQDAEGDPRDESGLDSRTITSYFHHIAHISCARACVSDLRRTEWIGYSFLSSQPEMACKPVVG